MDVLLSVEIANLYLFDPFLGSTPAPQRRELWRSRRVFFLTPQVMVNDLSRNTCPAPQIKCVVIDEAHKASGNHAYCQVLHLEVFFIHR